MSQPVLHEGLPVLVVGDVHGDIERLFQALKPYPAGDWHTIFLGDIVDGGPFGVGALRYAHDRPHSTVLLGNHEALMLAALRDKPTRGPAITRWLGAGGQPHDLDELERRPELHEWMRNLPALVRLEDRTVVQHSDNDNYGRLIGGVGAANEAGDAVAEINAGVRALMAAGEEERLWDLLLPQRLFREQPLKLRRWLERTGGSRVVHGHTPHDRPHPDVYAGGLAIDYDGKLSRYNRRGYRGASPLAASVGPLPRLAAPEG